MRRSPGHESRPLANLRLFRGALFTFLAAWLAATPLAAQEAWYPLDEAKAGGKDERAAIQEVQEARDQLLQGVEGEDDTIILRGMRQEYRQQEHTYVLSGFVQVWKGPDFYLTAERVEYNHWTDDLYAEGDVVVRLGPDRLAGDSLLLNIEDRTGSIENCLAYFEPSLYLKAKRLDLLLPNPETGRQRIAVEHASFTSCAFNPTADWSITATEAYAEVERNIQMFNSVFKVWKVPVFYFPYWYHPIRSDRATGFLLPKVGSSRNAGWYIQNEFFWAMNDYADATFGFDFSQEAGTAQHVEARYNLSERSKNNYLRVERLESAYALDSDIDTGLNDFDTEIYNAYLLHSQTFGNDWRFKLNVDYTNQFFLGGSANPNVYGLTYYRQDFRSYATVTKTIDKWTFIGETRWDNNLEQSSETDFFYLPRLSASLSEYRLGDSDLYFNFSSTADYALKTSEQDLGNNTTLSLEDDLFRANIETSIRYQLNALSWLKVEPRVGLRTSFFSKGKLDPIPEAPGGTWLHRADGVEPIQKEYDLLAGVQEMGSGLRRDQYFLETRITGPTLERIFDIGGDKLEKLQHLIQPIITYRYEPQVDAVAAPDIGYGFLFPGQVNAIDFSLNNIFTGRYITGYDDDGDATFTKREMVRLRISQTYNILNERRRAEEGPPATRFEEPWSHTVVDLDVTPFESFTFNLDANVDPLISRVDTLQFGGNYYRTRFELALYLTWSRDETIFNLADKDQASSSIGVKVIPAEKWAIEATHTFNFTESLHQKLGLGVTYKWQCWGVSFATVYEERFVIGTRDQTNELSYEFSVHLRNLGELGSANIGRFGARF